MRAAYLVICGLGYFESYLNGKKTETICFRPLSTRYDAECMYLVYDVRSLIREGENALGVALGQRLVQLLCRGSVEYARRNMAARFRS